MNGFNEWLSLGNSPVDESQHAIRAWNLIQRMNTKTIQIIRGGSLIGSFTVRVEPKNSIPTQTGTPNDNATTFELGVVVFGVRNHPDDAVVDTNIRVNDKFGIAGADGVPVSYQVQEVKDYPGEIQAVCVRLRK